MDVLMDELTWTSFTKLQVETNFSVRRDLTGEHSRGPSLSVRPEPQHDWSSNAPQRTIE